MNHFPIDLLLILLIAAQALAVPAPQKSTPLKGSYDVSLRTVLVDNGEPRAAVVEPEDAAYKPLAVEFVKRFAETTGSRLPVVTAAAAQGSTALVVLGNSGTGKLALRLYANKLIGSDAAYPGKGGHEFRTIPGAMDLGRNIVFIGGSSPAGVTAAMGAFFDTLTPGRDAVMPHTIRWVCPAMTTPRPLTDADIERSVKHAWDTLRAFRSNQYRSVCGQFYSAAGSYYLTGDDSYGRLCARLVDVLDQHWDKAKPKPPTFVMQNVVMGLDQVEESPGMTDAARAQAAEWVRKVTETTMDYWEMREPKRRYRDQALRPIWNHETHPAVSVAHAAQFLKARYSVPAADYWEAVVDHLFRGQITCDQPLEDSANYQWSVAKHTTAYVLATGRLTEYFTNGSLNSMMEYAIASHDSQGNEATHGDAWSPFGSTAASLFRAGATSYHDPRFQWMLGRLGSATSGMWSYPTALESAAPDDHVGLKVFMVHPSRSAAYGVEGVPTERVLDKAVFRSGWDANADYMMLDGLNVGNHKHLDANAIIRFSTQRRYWLVDMDYIRAAPKHHNSIAVVRDGVGPDQSPASRKDAHVIAEQPFAAELLFSAGSRDRGVVQSRLNDYAGLDWTRTVFWKAKGFFVVVDRLKARKPGNYVVRAFWRTLGEAKLDGRTLHVCQRGQNTYGNAHVRIVEDDGRTVVECASRQAQLEFDADLAKGKHQINIVAKGMSGGQDSLWFQVDSQPRVGFHLSIGKYGRSAGSWEKNTPTPGVTFDKPGRHHFKVTLRESPPMFIDRIEILPEKGDPLTFEAEEIVWQTVERIEEPEQHFYIVNADGARLKLRESFDYGHGGRDGYYAHYPYADKITKILAQARTADMREGDVMTYANLFQVRGDTAEPYALRPVGKNAWLVGDDAAVVAVGPAELPGLTIPQGFVMLTKQELTAAGTPPQAPEPAALLARIAARAKPAPLPEQAPRIDAPARAALWTAKLNARVTALAGDASGLFAGTESGRVNWLDSAGKVRRSVEVGSRVRSLALSNRGAVLVGTHAGQAIALDAKTGAKLWAYECQPYHGRTGSVATIFPADLDGDGKHETVAGSDNWHYHGLAADGKLLWRTTTVHASTVGCAGDYDGDGKDDVVAGTEYYWPRILASSGKQIGRLSDGPVTCATLMADIDGDGKAEAFVGMEDGFVRCIKQSSRPAWRANVGAAPTALAALDVDGDGSPEIICASESSSVYALRGDGTQAWRTQLTDSVNAMAVVGDRIVPACDDGSVYILDHAGAILSTTRLPAPATAVAASDSKLAATAAGRSVVAVRVDQ